jgi:hypothetical protein
MLFLIRLEQLGIRTHLWPYRGRQDRPPVRTLGGGPGPLGVQPGDSGPQPGGLPPSADGLAGSVSWAP